MAVHYLVTRETALLFPHELGKSKLPTFAITLALAAAVSKIVILTS